MDKLWAPWRIPYILEVDKTEGCIFCEKWGEGRDEESLLIYRGTHCFVILNLFPYNNGHLMIVPVRHVADLSDLLDEEKLEVVQLTERAMKALRQVMGPEGFNVGMNVGRVAGAGIEDHLHVHIVPRWSGDTNFMSVLGDTKVISESLKSCYWRLREVF